MWEKRKGLSGKNITGGGVGGIPTNFAYWRSGRRYCRVGIRKSHRLSGGANAGDGKTYSKKKKIGVVKGSSWPNGSLIRKDSVIRV